jgi:hypothetical protein
MIANLSPSLLLTVQEVDQFLFSRISGEVLMVLILLERIHS